MRREKKQGYTMVFSISSILEKGDERVCQNESKGNGILKGLLNYSAFKWTPCSSHSSK